MLKDTRENNFLPGDLTTTAWEVEDCAAGDIHTRSIVHVVDWENLNI